MTRRGKKPKKKPNFWTRLRAFWSRLANRSRALVIAGLVALLGIIGTSITMSLKELAKSATELALEFGKDLACEYQIPRPSQHDRPLILLAGFEDDLGDKMRSKLRKLLYDDTGYAVLESCVRFTSTDPTRQFFLRKIAPHMLAAQADLVLFGSVFEENKIKIWTYNSLGGCDWQSSSVNLDDWKSAQDQIPAHTRSILFRTILQGLIAACDRSKSADWNVVGVKIDQTIPYIQRYKSILTKEDFSAASMSLFSLSVARYKGTMDDDWFRRTVRATTLLEEAGAAEGDRTLIAISGATLAWLHAARYEKTKTTTDLYHAIENIQKIRIDRPSDWLSYLINIWSFDEPSDLVQVLDAGREEGLSKFTDADIESIRKYQATK